MFDIHSFVSPAGVQATGTGFGWTRPSRKEASSSSSPSPTEETTGAEEAEGGETTSRPPTSASAPATTGSQRSMLPAPSTGDAEEERSRQPAVTKMTTGSCESVFKSCVKTQLWCFQEESVRMLFVWLLSRETIQADMEVWESSGQWVFSCYSNSKASLSGVSQIPLITHRPQFIIMFLPFYDELCTIPKTWTLFWICLLFLASRLRRSLSRGDQAGILHLQSVRRSAGLRKCGVIY